MARLILRSDGRESPATKSDFSSWKQKARRRIGKMQLYQVLLRPGAPLCMSRKRGSPRISSHLNGAFDPISATRRPSRSECQDLVVVHGQPDRREREGLPGHVVARRIEDDLLAFLQSLGHFGQVTGDPVRA